MTTQRASFINHGTTPPIGYTYEIEHEGATFRFQAPMRLGLLNKIRLWYQEKQLPWPGENEIMARVEDYICQRLPPGFCKGGPKTPLVPLLSVPRIRDATHAFTYKALRHPDTLMVSQDEADRRAKTCANCPAHTHGICVTCAGNDFQDTLLSLKRAGRTTAYDSVLDICTICGCLVRARVHISKALLDLTPAHDFPANCWIHTTTE